MSMKKNYQELTNEIARSGGLQTDLRPYFDPIYTSWMQGDFLRKIWHSKKYPSIKIFVGLFFFILPSSIWIIGGFFSQAARNEALVGTLFLLSLVSMYGYIGIQLLLRGLRDLRTTKK